jgi:hypothetical protein
MPSVRCSDRPSQARRAKLELVDITRPRHRVSNYECICLTLKQARTYNIADAEVAQVVEQRTENPRVSGSTPLLGTTHEVGRQDHAGGRLPLRGETVEERTRVSRDGVPKWRKGRRDSLKNCWGATPVSVRIRPSAPERNTVPGCVVVAQRTLNPLAQVRILARQPVMSG